VIKVFINILSDKHIEPPTEEIIGDDQQPRLRIPVSTSAPREDMDKEGNTCMVFDCVMNPKTVERCLPSKQQNSNSTKLVSQRAATFNRMNDEGHIEFQSFVCQVAMDNITRKYKVEFQDKMKILNIKYKGGDSPPPQRIRKPQPRKASVVHELDPEQDAVFSPSTSHHTATSSTNNIHDMLRSASSTSSSSSSTFKTSSAHNASVQSSVKQPSSTNQTGNAKAGVSTCLPTFTTLCECKGDSKFDTGARVPLQEFLDQYVNDAGLKTLPSHLIIEINLPLVSVASSISLEISNGDIVLNAPTTNESLRYFLHAKLPFKVKDSEPTVRFLKKQKKLHVMLRVVDHIVQLTADETSAAASKTQLQSQMGISGMQSVNPSFDWRSELGLSNALMFDLVTI
jgi:hypothetical protein